MNYLATVNCFSLPELETKKKNGKRKTCLALFFALTEARFGEPDGEGLTFHPSKKTQWTLPRTYRMQLGGEASFVASAESGPVKKEAA